MNPPRRGALVLAIVLVASPLAAQAPAPAPADAPAADAPADPDLEKKKVEAKERFLRGLTLANDANWDAALAEFLASRELFPTRVALKNAATSFRNLKRYAEALDMYAELLAKFGAQIPAEEKKQIEDAMAELRSFVGEIDVESPERDATIVVDGQQRGTTPLPAPITVNAGTHSVRVSKEGFEAFETQVQVAGKQRKSVTARLKALSKAGRLVVQEADGKVLDVIVDGAVVGKTPWQGTLGVGVHSVALRGPENIGTPPATATVQEGQSATLSLRATKLDAQLKVEPVPTNSRVDIDGVTVGSGVWQGRLTSGTHRVEVVSEGHVPFRAEVTIASGKSELMQVKLERDLSNPMWKAGFVPHIYLELALGAAIAPALGGGADLSCSSSVTFPDGSSGEGCSDRVRPTGFFGGLRGGYLFTSGLGLELLVGYTRLSESMTRRVVTNGEGNTRWASPDYEDTTQIGGPLATLGASYQLLEKTPLLFRISGGVLRARIITTNDGTYTATVAHPRDSSITAVVTQSVRAIEETQDSWIPLIAPEVRFGYRFGKRFTLDLGVAGFVFFGPPSPRTSTTYGTDTARAVPLQDVPAGYGPGVDLDNNGVDDPVRLGLMTLPEEDAVKTFFAIVPTIGGRFDL
jgi:PEGA domain